MSPAAIGRRCEGPAYAGPRANFLSDVDLNLSRLRFLQLQDLDLQNAIAVRKSEAADKRAVAALDAVIVAVVLSKLRSPLTVSSPSS